MTKTSIHGVTRLGLVPGIGDLMLTCFGAELSRNCKCGQRLAK